MKVTHHVKRILAQVQFPDAEEGGPAGSLLTQEGGRDGRLLTRAKQGRHSREIYCEPYLCYVLKLKFVSVTQTFREDVTSYDYITLL